MQSYLKIGKKWSHISENVANRSQHSIKNRFYHLIAKQMNKTNREIIKSKELYKDEVILILEKLIAEKQVLNQNTNIKIENQNIKIELSESENIKTIA